MCLRNDKFPQKKNAVLTNVRNVTVIRTTWMLIYLFLLKFNFCLNLSRTLDRVEPNSVTLPNL